MTSTQTCPTTAIAAANEFLHLSWADDVAHPPIDQMKLQKLLFYSHAWYLAINDRLLFDDDFEAWPWGPVIRNVYYNTAKYDKKPIKEELTELRSVGSGPLDFEFVTPQVTDDEAKQYLRAVWETHRKFTGVQLSNSTHAPGEPWRILKDKYGSLDHKPTIPTSLIKAVYSRKLDASKSANTAAN